MLCLSQLFEVSVAGFLSDMGPQHTITLNAQCELYELHAEIGDLDRAKGLTETLSQLRATNTTATAAPTPAPLPRAGASAAPLPEAASRDAGTGQTHDAEEEEEGTAAAAAAAGGGGGGAAAGGAAAAGAAAAGGGGAAAVAGGNMYEAYCESALGLLKHKEAIALEHKQQQQQSQPQPQPGGIAGEGAAAGGADGGAAAAAAAAAAAGGADGAAKGAGVSSSSAALRKEAEALYCSALSVQVSLHGEDHAYTTKTARRLQSLLEGGDSVYCPHTNGGHETPAPAGHAHMKTCRSSASGQ